MAGFPNPYVQARNASGSGTGALTPAQVAAMSNSTAKLLPHWRAALGRVRTKSGDAKVLFVGDSITSGEDANNTLASPRDYSYPTQFAAYLTSIGIPAQAQSFMGDGFGSLLSHADPRLTIGGSWSDNVAIYSMGGVPFTASTSTNALAYKPTIPVTTWDIYWLQTTAASSFTWAIDGGGTTSVNTQNAAQAMAKTTVTAAAAGIHSLGIVQATGAPLIQGIDGYNTNYFSVHCINCGWPSGSAYNLTGNQNSQPFGPLACFAKILPDLVVYELTAINDLIQGNVAGLANFITFSSQVIAAAQAAGADVVLVAPNPVGITNTNSSLANQKLFNTAIYQMAASFNVPLVDMFDRLTSYEIASAYGLYATVSANNIHLNAKGYSDMAQALFDVIGPVGAGSIIIGTVRNSGQMTLVSGVATISDPNITISSSAQVQVISPVGTLGVGYKAVCTAGTLTVTAYGSAGTTSALDTSTLQYEIIY